MPNMDSKLSHSSPAHHGNSPPRKPKRPPPITPKRFNKFFTPRRTGSSTQYSTASRRLRDITHSAINRASTRRIRSKPHFQATKAHRDSNILTPDTTPKKRKAENSSSPPCVSSPIKRTRFSSVEIPSSPPQLDTVPENEILLSTPARGREPSVEPATFCQPIKRLSNSRSLRIIERSFGDRRPSGRGIYDSVVDFAHKSADFYSSPEDRLDLPHQPGLLTFSMASFHKKPLIAMGLEGGKILIQETSSSESFSTPYLYIDAHVNAVMDLDISDDDSMIASASGDQVAKIIDVRTRRVKARFDFDQACGTLKQVRFQPGNPFVVATSCREGFINIWDTRCHGKAQVEAKPALRPTKLGPLELGDEPTSCSTYTTPFLSIPNAHGDRSSLLASGSHVSLDAERGHVTRHGKVSVTSLSFLSVERSHMLVTGCDASASIRIWDIRARYNRRSGSLPVPISATAVPSNHATHRAFGLTSISLNSAGSRLYAVARDNIVYAYSTAHLILGHAPELDHNSTAGSSNTLKQQRFSSEGRAGLGPLYGFKNKNLHVGSFYIKAAMRSASCRKPEMLAVGSTSACTVLFPTDERDFINSQKRRQQPIDISTDMEEDEDPDATPIYELGTVLMNGHEKEVSALAWTYDGNLVTSDDRRVSRCWREDEPAARRCRTTGLRDPLTAKSGWADIVEEDIED